MAIPTARRLPHIRPLVAGAGLVATVFVAPGIAHAAPATAPHAGPHAAPHAKPTIAQIQKKLGGLAVQNTQLVEKFNQARIATKKAKKASTAATAKSTAAGRSYATAHSQYVKVVQSQYESGSFGAAGALLESNSDSEYMQRVSSMGVLSTHISQVVGRVSTLRNTANQASTEAAKLYKDAKTESDALAAQRKKLTTRIGSYRSLLQKLNSQQRAAYLRSQDPSVPTSALDTSNLPTAASAKAQRAVKFALAQVGKPYVFGAAGPSSYDCSGLTMQAWNAGGVSLPHSAANQFNYGTHVPLSHLTPGDLIFMYQPIGHVTIYIGDGYMVSAPTEGEDVTVVPVSSYSSDIVGATHLG